MPLERARPTTTLRWVLMPCARAMRALAPVARIPQPDLRAEEPVQRGDEQGGDEQQQGHGIFQTQLPHKALGYDQVVLVHADGLIGLARHDPQVYGIERQLRQNTGQNSGDAAAGMERSGDKACQPRRTGRR